MTTFAAVLRGASVLVLLSGLACAQDAMAILKSVGETYSALKSYEFQGATSAATQTGKTVSTTDESFTVVFTAPDRFFVEFRYPRGKLDTGFQWHDHDRDQDCNQGVRPTPHHAI